MPDDTPTTPRRLLDVLVAGGRRADRLTHVHELPARTGSRVDWPAWADPSIVAGYRAIGVERPWEHQFVAADAAWSGRHVALATSTGSGKSLAFWLPALTAVRADVAAGVLDPGRIETAARRGSVLYICPTKALAADQLSGLDRLLAAAGATDLRVSTCDGDTGTEERRWVQEHADVVLTNPDFLHFSLLPGHRRWARFLRDLRYVVVDEGHAYRGVFGAHVALVLRRLRRLAEHYGQTPVTGPGVRARRLTFVVASATSSDPAAGAARLIGVAPDDVLAVDADTSPAGHKTFALWEPPVIAGYEAAHGGDATDATLARSMAEALLQDPTAHESLVRGGSARDLDAWTVGSPAPVPWASANGPTGNPWGGVAAAGERASGDPVHADHASGDPNPGERASSDPVHADHASGDPAEPTAPARPAVDAPPPGLAAVPDDPAVPGDGPARPRRTATAEVADLLADLVVAGARTLAFTRSRRGAEAVATQTRDHLRSVSSALAGQVAAYRGGYLPEERRALEESLRSGVLRGLATTNALELGVDISGLDAVLIAGWPGTRMSLWQQAGRAGRAGADGLVAFVAREDPLDTYLVHHPEAIFDAPLEATVFDPANPYVLAPHLCAAAAEIPLRTTDLAAFGDPAAVIEILGVLVTRGALRRRASGWYWTHAQSAAGMTDLRGSGGAPVRVVEFGTGRLLGTVDAGSADGAVHDGAVYVHQGVTYVVEHLDLVDGVALVRRTDVDYGTWSRTVTAISVQEDPADSGGRTTVHREWGPIGWGYGPVEVGSQVVSFQRRRLPDLAVLGVEGLDLPERALPTMAVWWTVPEEVLATAGIDAQTAPGALHAAEHASIGLLPLLATCDRWDLGGVSTALHVDTERATVFVYDAYPGGAGFAERGYQLGAIWLRATREAIVRCPCADGCPACVQSPKCGSYNSPLEKAAAVRLLDAVLAHAPG